MLLADLAPQIFQADWQALATGCSILGGAIVGAAKILANQWDKNTGAEAKRHDESRQDAKEAREENRVLSQIIIKTQAESVRAQSDIARVLSGIQREIAHMVTRLDRIDGGGGGSKSHSPLAGG